MIAQAIYAILLTYTHKIRFIDRLTVVKASFQKLLAHKDCSTLIATTAMQVLWFIPTHGDGRYLATAEGGRATNYAYLRQIAQAVDHLGYTGALLPTGRSCEDAWVVASTLVSHTQRMRFLVAIRLPRLPLENPPVTQQHVMFSPFGEIVANEVYPKQLNTQTPLATVD